MADSLEHASEGFKSKSRASCCVPDCVTPGYIVEGGKRITFHKLPVNDQKRLRLWIVKIRRDQGPLFKVTQHTRICSRHFLLTDFRVTFKGKRFLKDGVVPSLFKFKAPVKMRLCNKKENTVPTPTTCSNVDALSITPHTDENATTNEINVVPNEKLNTYHKELLQKIEELEKKLGDVETKCDLVKKERDHVRGTLQMRIQTDQTCVHFCIENFQHSDGDICFYTGFPTMNTLECCYKLLDPENNMYYRSTKGERKRLKNTNLSYKNQFFLTLVRLRLGLLEKDLANRFGLSQSTVHRYYHAWLTYMYLRLGSINIWPSKEQILRTMPESMKSKYPTLEWIIDAFEIQTQRPASLLLQSQSFSSYKGRNTVKGLVACTPSGQIGFVSQLYTGSISDRELVIRSGFLDMPHNHGASWLVDRGFQIQDLADKHNVTVNIPAFVGPKGHLTAAEVFKTQSIASERIHIERAINKIKKFHFFDRPVPISTLATVNQTWTVAALLTLFQRPIISA